MTKFLKNYGIQKTLEGRIHHAEAKRKVFQPKILYLVKLSFKNEGKHKDTFGQTKTKRICNQQTGTTRTAKSSS